MMFRRLASFAAAAALAAAQLSAFAPSAAAAAVPVPVITSPAATATPVAGVPFTVTGSLGLGAGTTLSFAKFLATGCTAGATTVSGSTASAVVYCTASAKAVTLRLSVTTAQATTGSVYATYKLTGTPPAYAITATRTGDVCTGTRKTDFSVTASGEPVFGLPIALVSTAPGATTSTTVSIVTDRTGHAYFSTPDRTGWKLTSAGKATNLWPAKTGPTLTATADACRADLQVTSTLPAKSAYGRQVTFTGTARALRTDGASAPMVGAKVVVKQTQTTANGDVTSVLGIATTAAAGAWTIKSAPTASGTISAQLVSTSTLLNPASEVEQLGTLQVQQFIGSLTASATPTASPLLAGGAVKVAGTLSTVNPVTGLADTAAVVSVPLDVMFTQAGTAGTGYRLGGATTTTGGAFSTTVTAPGSGTISVRLRKDVVAMVAVARNVAVTAQAVPVLKVSATTVTAGRPATVQLEMKPRSTTAVMQVQQRLKGTTAWTDLGLPHPAGYTRVTAPTLAGAYELRAWYAGGTIATAGGSAVVPVTVANGVGTYTAPTDLDCSSTSGATATCSWTAPATVAVSGYEVLNKAGTVVASTTGATTLTLPEASTPLGVPSEFRVRGVSASGPTASSEPDTVTRLATPSLLDTSDRTETSINLKWKAVTGAASYRVSVDSGTPVEIPADAGTAFLAEGFNPGSTHTFSVTAIAATLDTSASSTVSGATATPVRGSAPAALACTSTTASAATCSWVAVPGATAYKVYLDSVALTKGIVSLTPFPTNADGTVTSTGAKLTGLTAGETVTLTVTAIGAGRESRFSNAVELLVASPPPPTVTLSAPKPTVDAYTTTTDASSATIPAAQLSWPVVPSATSYTVTVTPDGGTAAQTVTSTVTEPAVLVPLPSTALVKVTVKATGGQYTVPSATAVVRVRAPEAAPRMTCVSLTTVGVVECSWAGAAGAAGYKVTVNDAVPAAAKLAPEAPWTFATNATSGTYLKFTDAAAAGSTLAFAVTPVDAAGAAVGEPYTQSVLVYSQLGTPIPRVDPVSASTTAPGAYVVSWDAVPNATGYKVLVTGLATTPSSVTYTVADPSVAVQLPAAQAAAASVQVSATGAIGYKSSGTLPLALGPSPASSLVCTAGSAFGSASCSWTAFPAAVSYRVSTVAADGTRTVRTTGVAPASGWPAAVSGAVRSPAATLSSLAQNAEVTVAVDAVLSSGETVSTNTATFRTNGPKTALALPNLRLVSSGGARALSWPAVPNAAGYQVKFGAAAAVTVAADVTSIAVPAVTVTTDTTVIALAPADSVYANSAAATVRIGVSDASAVSGLACTSTASGTVTCSWAAATDAAGYQLRATINGVAASATMSSAWKTASGLAGATSASLSGLTASSIATVSVAAVDSAGTAGLPASVTLRVLPTPALSAPVPRVLSSGVSGTSGQVTVGWDAVTGASTYVATITGPSGFTTRVVSVSGTQVTFDALTPGTTYVVAVKATAQYYTDSAAAALNVNPSSEPL